MKTRDVLDELHCLAAAKRIFPLAELQDFADPSLEPATLYKYLARDPRFIRACDDRSGEKLFVLDSILFEWLVNLNMRLAKISNYKLSEKQVTVLFSMLRGATRFDHPPTALILWGQRFGLICKSWTGDHYVFPFAKILSEMDERARRTTADILTKLIENRAWKLDLDKRADELISTGLSLFEPNVSFIITRREALSGGRKWTLQRLGDSFQLTRERIRQLEEKFWHSIDYGYHSYPTFIEAFLCDYMSGAGALIIDRKSPKTSRKAFLARCARIEITAHPKLGFRCLAQKAVENALMNSQSGLNLILNWRNLAKQIDSNSEYGYSGADIKIISERIARYNRRRLTKSQKVFLALSSIARPAHYSKVTSVHNRMWPESIATENSVHAILSRQRMGIVWIGRKGIYALRDWGYQRPSKSLFATVAEIVRNKHKETKKPVNASLVAAELGKYRRHVNPQSLTIALTCNPLIRCAGKGVYLPSEKSQEAEEGLGLDRIDISLERFRRNRKRKA